MKDNNILVKKERRLIRELTLLIDKSGNISLHEPDVHEWDDGKIYFYDGEKENCVNDHPELIKAITNICQEYFKLKQRKIEHAKILVAKQRAKKQK